MLPRPRVDQPHYSTHLGDAGYWGGYVREVCDRHDLPQVEIETPFVGTFPTFLVGDAVVKLFGHAFGGGESHAAEQAMHRLLDSPRARAIPAPKVLADGDLFDDDGTGWHWPYLVFERIPGVAIRELPADDDFAAIAEHLGEIAAAVHLLTPPADVRARDLLPRLRADAARRCVGFGLPAHLAAQVPAYLADALPPDTLVHADITADHLFVANGAISGLIDWGDAIVADPFYELPAVYLDALRGERPLLSAFLHGSGWLVDGDFSRRALQGILEFQFNAIMRIRELLPVDDIGTLDGLAEALFTV